METNKKIILFLIITFSITWSIEIGFWLLGGKWIPPSSLTIYLSMLIMYIPAIGAIIVEKLIYKKNLKELGISFKFNKWWIIAWIIPLLISLLSILASLLFPEVSFSSIGEGIVDRYKNIIPPEQLYEFEKKMLSTPFLQKFTILIINDMIFGLTINAIFAFGEELGWRGFLTKYLGKMSFLKNSLLIGLIWGIWHAPLVLQGHNYPTYRIEGVFMMTAFCILLTPIFTFIRFQSKSVIPCAIMHGTINSTAGISIIFLKGGNELYNGIFGIAGLFVLFIVDLIIFIVYREST